MPRSILVADDNPLIRRVLCRLFEATEDYELCAEATNGREAIELALKHRPDLIILDLSMPVLNGVDAAKELKKIMPNVPIILFTQHADLTDTILGAHLPVDRIVSKSEPAQLMGHIRSLIPPTQSASTASM
ncbi:MAG: response regulator transcription factor [Candidatus Acidiferrales bacterium]